MSVQYKNKQEAWAVRGQAAEYLVNNTLWREMNAVRFKNKSSSSKNYLFDSLIIPHHNDKRNHSEVFLQKEQRLTELDHVLVTRKGIFIIETKSINGSCYGELGHKKWVSVFMDRNGNQRNRTFQNPAFQNRSHQNSLLKVLKSSNLKTLKYFDIIPMTFLVNANEWGWEKGRWIGDHQSNLFTDVSELVDTIKSYPNVMKQESVDEICECLSYFYDLKDKVEGKFLAQWK